MSDDGAPPREILLGACRTNNTDSLFDLFSTLGTVEKIASLLNTATDGIGQYCLHIAAGYGKSRVLDFLLDQEGLETDPIDRIEQDIPLHSAVRFINSCSPTDWDEHIELVEMLLDAGADPLKRNKAKLKPLELADPRNKRLRARLAQGERDFLATQGADLVGDGDDEEEDGGGPGSASDDD